MVPASPVTLAMPPLELHNALPGDHHPGRLDDTAVGREVWTDPGDPGSGHVYRRLLRPGYRSLVAAPVSGNVRSPHRQGRKCADRIEAQYEVWEETIRHVPNDLVIIRVSRYGTTRTGVPTGAQSYSQAATSSGKLTQPWLIGVPKLSCQYVPCRA